MLVEILELIQQIFSNQIGLLVGIIAVISILILLVFVHAYRQGREISIGSLKIGAATKDKNDKPSDTSSVKVDKFSQEAEELRDSLARIEKRLDDQIPEEKLAEILKLINATNKNEQTEKKLILPKQSSVDVEFKPDESLYYKPRPRPQRNLYLVFTRWDIEDVVQEIFWSFGDGWAGASFNKGLEPFLEYSLNSGHIHQSLAREISDFFSYTAMSTKSPISDVEFAKIQYLAFEIMEQLTAIKYRLDSDS